MAGLHAVHGWGSDVWGGWLNNAFSPIRKAVHARSDADIIDIRRCVRILTTALR